MVTSKQHFQLFHTEGEQEDPTPEIPMTITGPQDQQDGEVAEVCTHFSVVNESDYSIEKERNEVQKASTYI